MKKRPFFVGIFWVLLLLSLFIAVGVSCKGEDSARRGKTRLEFWTISLKPTYEGYINNIIKSYEEKHPDVWIDWVDVPISVVMQKFMASVAGGAPPDVVNLDTGYALSMAQNRALVNMDEAVSPEKKALYFPGIWRAVNFEGSTYAVPWYVTTRVVIYNKEIFKKAGLDPEKPPKTYDEVDKYARIIKEKTGIYGYMPAFKLQEDFQVWGVPMVSENRKEALFDSSEGVKMLQWFVDLKNDGIMPEETLAEGYSGALNRFQAGNLGMLIVGPTLLLKIKSDAPEIYKKTWVGAMPLGAGKVIPAAVMNLSVPRSSKNRDLAVDFALYVTNDANQLKFCKEAPLLPSTKFAARDEFFEKGKGDPLQDEAIRISIKQLEHARDLSLGLPNSVKLNRILKEALESAYYGRKSPKEALSNAVKEWNLILSQ